MTSSAPVAAGKAAVTAAIGRRVKLGERQARVQTGAGRRVAHALAWLASSASSHGFCRSYQSARRECRWLVAAERVFIGGLVTFPDLMQPVHTLRRVGEPFTSARMR